METLTSGQDVYDGGQFCPGVGWSARKPVYGDDGLAEFITFFFTNRPCIRVKVTATVLRILVTAAHHLELFLQRLAKDGDEERRETTSEEVEERMPDDLYPSPAITHKDAADVRPTR
ncbi:hypothetical protein HPP92_029077 [Vanilla planifolia]|uniref:Uncharacterized protein n=1 Tax=Vanilla planifolia TaxID=51239 RepID=A0A835P335_VANPL|nr:hypothetical protein HPP92_029066 [Vanilla planifolia]KAG0445966.1 hypothetical protein HPP92_029077 [Vanilla planifolia]